MNHKKILKKEQNKRYRLKHPYIYKEHSLKYYYKNKDKCSEYKKYQRTNMRKQKYYDQMYNAGLYWAKYIDWNKENLSIKQIRTYININNKLYITINDFNNHNKKFKKCLNKLNKI